MTIDETFHLYKALIEAEGEYNLAIRIILAIAKNPDLDIVIKLCDDAIKTYDILREEKT